MNWQEPPTALIAKDRVSILHFAWIEQLQNPQSINTGFSQLLIALTLASLAGCNGGGGSTPIAANDRPTAADLFETIEQFAALEINLAAEPGVNFGDEPYSIAVTDEPQDGEAVVSGTMLTYTPQAVFFGLDEFAYTITDSDGQSATGRVTIEVTETTIAPIASINFPSPLSFTDATAITVTGTASDGGVVSRVRVNGIDASSTDGFAHWRAVVPLAIGEQTLTVETTDASGNNDSAAAQAITRVEPVLALFDDIENLALNSSGDRVFGINRALTALIVMDDMTGAVTIIADATTGFGPLFGGSGLALDEVNGLAFVDDGASIITVDLATGDRTIFSGPGTGAGPSFRAPSSYAIDFANNRLLVANIFENPSPDDDEFTLMAVDLTTRDRTVLSGMVCQEFRCPSEIEFDSANNRVLVPWPPGSSVQAVDLATGNWTRLSGGATGTGPVFHWPQDVALDAAGNRIFVTDFSNNHPNSIISVDLGTGDRTTVVDTNSDMGAMLIRPESIVWDSMDDRVIVSDEQQTGVTGVDVATGDLTIISAATIGSGPSIVAYDVTVDNFADRVLWSSFELQGLVAADFSTGNRTIFSSKVHDVGTGPSLGAPRGIAMDVAGNRILVVDQSLQRVTAVDLATGNRRIISDAVNGVGPMFNSPRDIALDANSDRAVVIDQLPWAIVDVDLVSGNRSIISDAANGTGPALTGAHSVVVDAGRGLAFIADSSLDAVLSVDLANGDRQIISEAGTGPALVNSGYLALDVANDRVLTSDWDLAAIVAIELTSGDRTIVADNQVGQGPTFTGPGALAIDGLNDRVVIYQRRGLLMVEPGSGDRVIFSQ